MNEDIKNEILSRSDLIEIISDYVVLNKRGKNFIGLCPFHSEKTPSFTVSPDKQIYKCFGCGKSGNVISFLMEKNALSFPETLKFLASKYGLNYNIQQASPEKTSEIEEIYSVLDIAAKFFEESLLTKSGKTCLNYYESRKFSKKTIEEFRLGYSPNSFDALSKHLRDLGFSDYIMAEAGLSVTNDDGKTYDRFRNRAIFPIFDLFGRIIGFGARLLTNERTQAKYLNSPQTKVYDKSKVLYGLFQGKNEIINRKHALLVEGYADVLTLHQNGFKHSIASSGTALTNEQLKLLSRYTKKLTIIYDADSAGINATERAIETSLHNKFEPTVVSLQQGEDPDSILRDKGNTIFQGYLDNSSDFISFLFNKYKDTSEFGTSLGKTDIIKKIMQVINLVKDSIQQDLLIQELASKFDFNDFQMRNLYKLKSQLKIESHKRESLIKDNEVKNTDEIEENIQFEKKCKLILKRLKHSEIILFNLMLKNEEAFAEVLNSDFSSNCLITQYGQKIFDYLVAFPNLQMAIESLSSEDINPYLANVITTLSIEHNVPSDNWDKYYDVTDQVSTHSKLKLIYITLELETVENEISNLQKKLKDNLSDLERVSTLESISDHSKRKNDIKNLIKEF